MRLNAEGVNRNVIFAKAAKHGEDGFALCFVDGGVGFDVVVVVGEQRGGIGFGGGAESYIEVVFADVFQPNGIYHVVGIVVGWLNGFVHDVPGVDAAPVAADDGLDVGAEKRDGIFRGCGGLQPVGIMLMPAEVVAAGEDLVGFRKVHERIGAGEIVAVRLGMGGAPLHLILCDENGALFGEERDELGALELPVRNRSAKIKSLACGYFPQFGDFGRPQRQRKGRGGEGAE